MNFRKNRIKIHIFPYIKLLSRNRGFDFFLKCIYKIDVLYDNPDCKQMLQMVIKILFKFGFHRK